MSGVQGLGSPRGRETGHRRQHVPGRTPAIPGHPLITGKTPPIQQKPNKNLSEFSEPSFLNLSETAKGRGHRFQSIRFSASVALGNTLRFQRQVVQLVLCSSPCFVRQAKSQAPYEPLTATVFFHCLWYPCDFAPSCDPTSGLLSSLNGWARNCAFDSYAHTQKGVQLPGSANEGC